MAFEGWNDAADAATDALEHLMRTYPTEEIYTFDTESFYDFQSVRPRMLVNDEGERDLVWPTTSMTKITMPERDVIVITGPEPNYRWREYTTMLISAVRSVNPSLVIVMGAMLSDAPHSRPVPVNGMSGVDGLIDRLGLGELNYEGPTGISGVITVALRRAYIPYLSLWAQVPHYVASNPNPKVVLALLSKIELALDVVIDLGDIPSLAMAWQNDVDELASEDIEVVEYIEQLERQQDREDLPISGDSIAAEFEQYLRHRRHDD